jgi:hypothetical protein
LPWVKRAEPVKVTGADGTPIEGAGVRYTTPLIMRIGHHQEGISWEIGQLKKGISGYLPIQWLTKHNPEIDWETGVLRWRSDFCRSHCLPISMQEAVRNFVKLLREAKVWGTEADAEPGEKATGVGSTSKANTDAEPGGKTTGFGSTGKANSGPAGKAAGGEKPGPAGKTVGTRRYRPACKAAEAEKFRLGRQGRRCRAIQTGRQGRL